MISREILKKISFVVVDLDGTLLDDEAGIGKETLHLVSELRKKGVEFTIATGRLPNAIDGYTEMLGIQLPLITLDGTYIAGKDSSEVIYTSVIPAKHVARAVRLAQKHKLKIALCHDSAIYFTEENSIIPAILEKMGAKYTEIPDFMNYFDGTLEIVITGDFRNSIKHVANRMSFPWAFGIQPSYYKSHNHGGIYYLEIRKMGCSKGSGLKRLLKHLNIDIKNTAVIGDWYNDVSLFETDALKVAVANAVPELKRAADIVTKRTNNEDAVAEFLSVLLKAKTE